MRQLFETEAHLVQEAKVAKALAALFPAFDWRKLPDRYIADYAICKNRQVRSMVEIKWKSKFWAVPHVSYSKVKTLMMLASPLKAFVCVADPFLLRLAPVEQLAACPDIVWNGRNEARDAEDCEPCFAMPHEQWKSYKWPVTEGVIMPCDNREAVA